MVPSLVAMPFWSKRPLSVRWSPEFSVMLAEVPATAVEQPVEVKWEGRTPPVRVSLLKLMTSAEPAVLSRVSVPAFTLYDAPLTVAMEKYFCFSLSAAITMQLSTKSAISSSSCTGD